MSPAASRAGAAWNDRDVDRTRDRQVKLELGLLEDRGGARVAWKSNDTPIELLRRV